VITARVSHISAYARWKAQEDADLDWLLASILTDKPTEAMLKGTAFHKFLEHAQAGSETQQTTIDGYTFAFVGEFDLYLPTMREQRRNTDYGGIIVSGQCDAFEGSTIYDHKSTERFDAENYLESWQWRFYLDIFNADRFIWNVWEMNELVEPMSYGVNKLHELTQYRYPTLHADCVAMAQEYRDFAEKHIPQAVTA
jgi:hypothetical protein